MGGGEWAGISILKIIFETGFLFSPPLFLGWGEGARRADEGDQYLN